MSKPFKYGKRWPEDAESIDIELAMIALGGKSKDYPEALPLFDHYMNARKLCWPRRYRHRWTDLMYGEFIRNDITILMGAASTGKTSTAAEFCLLSYFSRPDNTLVIVSTITMEKLETGVWGEIKMLWRDARSRFDWLPGNMIEGKKAIATDEIDIEGGSVRDLRKGCIGKACFVGGRWVGMGTLCFPAGQLIDTPFGQRRIESIQPDDVVLNARGVSTVMAVGTRIAPTLVRIYFKDGRMIDCTPEHKFFTGSGWKAAIDLDSNSYVLSSYETMRLLREGYLEEGHSGLLRFGVQQEIQKQDLPGMPPIFFADRQSQQMLFQELHDEIEDERSCFCRENAAQHRSSGKGQGGVHWNSIQCRAFAPNERRVLAETASCEPSKVESRSGHRHDSGREGSKIAFPGSTLQFLCADRLKFKARKTASLLPGFCLARNQTRSGGGWPLPRFSNSEIERPAAASLFEGARVDRVEVLKPQGDARYNESEGGYRVYNLQVKGHPSYSVNGLLAHNSGIKQDYIFYIGDELSFMAETYLGAWPNLFSNGNVKIIGSGNPKHDPYDQLGLAAEPKIGWTSIGVPERTAVWDTKFMGGRCVNLVGTDSPNFDVGEGEAPIYPKLINRKFAERIANDYGPESPQFYTQVKGIMRIDFAHERVITRQLCREHNAGAKADWANDERTRILGIDPSYGGDDRCVGIVLEFGEGLNGLTLVRVVTVLICKLRLDTDKEVEDQIADWAYATAESHEIPHNNIFYDSVGKGTLGFHFAKKFGLLQPIPVDSGTEPTDRPVRENLLVFDPKTQQQRPKTCKEHYYKFVSELWFSVRYAIMANQVRELPEAVMIEGCARIYEQAKGNKIAVEPKSDPKKKEDLKRRLGKSPDLFDALVIGIEGCRQRGFGIASLGPVNEVSDDDSSENPEALEYEEAIKKNLLDHTA